MENFGFVVLLWVYHGEEFVEFFRRPLGGLGGLDGLGRGEHCSPAYRNCNRCSLCDGLRVHKSIYMSKQYLKVAILRNARGAGEHCSPLHSVSATSPTKNNLPFCISVQRTDKFQFIIPATMPSIVKLASELKRILRILSHRCTEYACPLVNSAYLYPNLRADLGVVKVRKRTEACTEYGCPLVNLFYRKPHLRRCRGLASLHGIPSPFITAERYATRPPQQLLTLSPAQGEKDRKRS